MSKFQHLTLHQMPLQHLRSCSPGIRCLQQTSWRQTMTRLKSFLNSKYNLEQTQIRILLWSIVNFERMFSISNVGNLKFEEKCLIPQLKLSVLGMTNTGCRKEIKLIRRSALEGGQCLILRFTIQSSDLRFDLYDFIVFRIRICKYWQNNKLHLY